jgi:lipopolysaccharide/colanic/teichoic acid biosynthesis glycosyltransferase
MQRLIALILAVVTAPILMVLATVIRLESRGSPVHLASRVGEDGRIFRMAKLRTMRVGDSTQWPAISVTNDRRVTRVGRVLRRRRLDELPQLWNVVRGEMRLVGPRPEDPRFVDLADPLHRRVFLSRPGMTGLAQLVHFDEAEAIDPDDPETSYRNLVLPAKLRVDAAYLSRRTTSLDVWILGQTIAAVSGRRPDLRALSSRLGVVLPVPSDDR